MEITSNLTSVIGDILGKFALLGNPDTITRAVATAMMPTIRKRIHVEGKNSSGGQIGVYSNAYLRLREKKYKRFETDVIASLTRQLEGGYVLGATKDGYTIDNLGNKIDNDNKTKTEYLEDKYGKIWDLTEKELQDVLLIANEETKLIMQ
jgi:hypothetical protein